MLAFDLAIKEYIYTQGSELLTLITKDFSGRRTRLDDASDGNLKWKEYAISHTLSQQRTESNYF